MALHVLLFTKLQFQPHIRRCCQRFNGLPRNVVFVPLKRNLCSVSPREISSLYGNCSTLVYRNVCILIFVITNRGETISSHMTDRRWTTTSATYCDQSDRSSWLKVKCNLFFTISFRRCRLKLLLDEYTVLSISYPRRGTHTCPLLWWASMRMSLLIDALHNRGQVWVPLL